ncbi:MAG: sulfurtransferase complex subunit TusC [Methylovulum sp.]|nr:sulfurtransferase complex subunit TusC [Methylovulum sp.]
MKRYLFVLRKPPHSGAYVQEMLDIILTTAAFDQHVALVLLDDGVFQLKKNQHPAVGIKETAAIFAALELYDVTALYAEAESLEERGLAPEDLCLPVRTVRRKALGALMQQYDVVFPG